MQLGFVGLGNRLMRRSDGEAFCCNDMLACMGSI